MKRTIILIVGLILVFSGVASAQDKEREPNTYIKFGIVHTQGNIDWADYVLNGFSVEIESHFKDNHLGLSGWSLGYRKDDIRYSEFGHMLNIDTFRTQNLKVGKLKTDVKFGGGVEWGMPSHSFSHTRFNGGAGNDFSYSHVFLHTNSDIPGTGTKNDGIIYPFVKLSFLKRGRTLLVEGGVRVSIMKFGIDEYSVSGDRLRVVTRDKRMAVPAAFISIGLGVGK